MFGGSYSGATSKIPWDPTMGYYPTFKERLKFYKIDNIGCGVDVEQWEFSYPHRENGNHSLGNYLDSIY